MSDQANQEVPVPTVFILGPSLDNVIEPAVVVLQPGRRQISFDAPATSPGGNVNMLLLPPVDPADALPINVYAFFFQPVENVPPADQRTPDWFFKSGAPNSSVHIALADPITGKFVITVPGVKPSLQPYFVQTVLEFQN